MRDVADIKLSIEQFSVHSGYFVRNGEQFPALYNKLFFEFQLRIWTDLMVEPCDCFCQKKADRTGLTTVFAFFGSYGTRWGGIFGASMRVDELEKFFFWQKLSQELRETIFLTGYNSVIIIKKHPNDGSTNTRNNIT